MHADERRSPERLQAQRAAELATNPRALLARVDGLQARHARDKGRLKELETALKQLEAELQTAREKAADSEDLTRRLGKAHGALEAYRAESVRLKSDLKKVRGSRSMRIGRAVLAPVAAARKVARLGSGEPLLQLESGKVADAGTAPGESQERITSGGAEPGSYKMTLEVRAAVPLGQRSLESLIEEFHATPSPEALFRVVNRQWHQQGLIREPADMLTLHAELAREMSAEQKQVAERILGHDRLAQGGAPVPPRARGAAYTPEPQRVMYCAHSTPVFNSNGYSTRTRGVAAGLRAGGVDVTVVARVGYPWDTAADVQKPALERSVTAVDDVEYVHIPGPPLQTTPIDRYVLAAADAFVREARLLRPAVMHAASNFRTALPALIAARRLGVPFVYEVRGLWEVTEASEKPGWEGTPRYREMAALETMVANEADVVLAITSQVADELERRGVDRAKMVLAANAVDPEQFVPLPKDERYAAKKKIRLDAPVIGFAGSIVGYEGLETLLDASALLRARGVDHQVVIAGSGAAAVPLKAKRDEGGFNAVTFLGRLPMADMPRLLSTFDIVALPRTSSPVTELVSPLKPLEAFSSAKAVVLSDVAPHMDLAGVDNPRALLFPAGDAAGLADRLQQLIIDPDLRADLGRTARLWTIDERNWQRLGQVIEGAYAFARSRHDAAISEGRELASLRVGLVADEFTTVTLSASVEVTALDRDRWREQLDAERFDLVFIESAWAGNGGQWTKGVGYYGEAENADLYGLLSACREQGIPTVFWNKEDPVHFDRFRKTAARCDHVFTTDANRILPYLETPESISFTASSLPFYAQPAIHNPLPARTAYEPTAAYAGTYYGDRYPTRSRQLRRLLTEASHYGLTIFDRQLAYPDSPYRFPPELLEHVRGHLPYEQVIDSYKSHLTQLNVNSVMDSPTMFSRRVVEVAGCGGVVLSGPGRGVIETFGGAIPASNDNAVWRALMHDWSTHAEERVREAWMQMRVVYRSHTVDTALTILARTAGLPVTAPSQATYGVLLDGTDHETLHSLARQSVLPIEAFTTAGFDEARAALAPLGVRVRGAGSVPQAGADWLAQLTAPVERTHFEDLLVAARFGNWNRILVARAGADDAGRPLAQPVDAPRDESGLVSRDLVAFSKGLERALTTRPVAGVEMLLPPASETASAVTDGASRVRRGPARVLVAGHDLKFAAGLLDALQRVGHVVEVDQWESHTQHDEERSLELLQRADIVFCEWGLGNAVWYSKHVADHQRLVVRVHSQELRSPHLLKITHTNVDAYVFVGELIRRAAVESHGVPVEKTVVIPNPVDVSEFRLPKHEAAARTLGLVGIVAQPKRLDRALDLLERLLDVDPRYRLRIKGKQPSDYPWMLDRPDEMAYYEQQFARIEKINAEHGGAVVLDGYGADMAEWYRHIGVAVSTSDFESFHLTIPDGAASGALPITIDWAGADLIYPRDWIGATVEEMAERVLSTSADPDVLAATVQERFGADHVLDELIAVIAPGSGQFR